MFKTKKTFYLERTKKDGGEGNKPSIFKGLVLGLLSGISFSIVEVLVKEMGNLHPSQIVLYRYIGMFLLNVPWTVKTGQNPFGPKESRWLLIVRGIFGTTVTFLLFASLQYLSLSVASCIVFSSPAFVTLFARVILKEPCGVFQSLTVLVTIIGLIFASKLPSQLTENPIIYSTETIYGLLAAIFAAVSSSFETVTIRKIRNVHEKIVMFNFCWFAILVSLFLTAGLGHFRWHHCGIQSLYILLIGFFSYAATEMMVIALQSEFAGPVYTMRAASGIVLSFLWQIIIFRDPLDIFGIIGAVLILFSVSSVNFSKWLSHLPPDSSLRRNFQWIIV